MKNKKYLKILIIIILSLSVLVVLILFESFPFDKEGVGEGLSSQIEALPLSRLSEKSVKVSLVIQEKKYEIEIKDGATVFLVMQKLKEESSPSNVFDFKYTEHPGLGMFINEINGLKEGEGGYFIYYVNGKEASVGVSNYKIKNGDIISWKYEK